MILDIYRDSISYSTKNIKVLLKLALMYLLYFLVIPVFLINGYEYRVIKTSIRGVINGRDQLPDFSNVKSLLTDGIKVTIITFIYLLIPIIIFLILNLCITTAPNGLVFLISYGVAVIVCEILALLMLLISNFSICHMAYNEGSFFKAFAFREIYAKIKEIGFLELIKLYLGLLIIQIIVYTILIPVMTFVVYSIFQIGIINPFIWVFSIFDLSILTQFDVILISFMEFILLMLFSRPFFIIFNARSIGLLYSAE